jgi:hypothetical protein
MITLGESIGVFDDVVSREWCDDVICMFEKKITEAEGLRKGDPDEDVKGVLFRSNEKRIDVATGMHKYQSMASRREEFYTALEPAFELYMRSITGQDNKSWWGDLEEIETKLQRTLAGGGFCVPHFEQGNDSECARRFGVYSLYLNDLPEHCGTEFPMHNAILTPKAGRLAIWPAAYTHPHMSSPETGPDQVYPHRVVRLPHSGKQPAGSQDVSCCYHSGSLICLCSLFAR